MAFVTTQTINRYYDCYRDTEIVFSKEIIHTLKMDPRQIYIKSGGLQWPCIVNSSSFNQAKIILGTNGGAYATLSKKDPDPVSLKFSFYNPDGQLMSFFVNAKVDIIQPYMNSTDLSLITIQYTQRPPDDLIVMLGSLVEANMNAIRRKEDRIHITQNSMRKLGLQRKELTVSIQNIQRNCILQDLSFGGAKIVLLGLSKFLLQKEAFLQLEFDDPHEMMIIKGIIVSTTPVEGRSDLIGASIQFQEDSISLAYKVRINNYISTMRKDELNANKDEQQDEVQKVSEAK